MSYVSRWDNGSWNVICDVCGRKYKGSELRLRWDGLMVCHGDWEPRQPQDFVRAVADIQAPVWARPENTDSFIPINYSQQPAEQIIVGEAVAKTATKVIGKLVLTSSSSLNGTYLNAQGLNADTYIDITPSTNPEDVRLTESFQVILGRTVTDSMSMSESVTKKLTKNISDSLPLSESLQLVEVERTVESMSLSESIRLSVSHNVSESISIAESVSTRITSPTVLNGSALNTFRLD